MHGPPVHMQAITCMGPAAAPLLPLRAAATASPLDGGEDAAVADAAPAEDSAVAAQTRVNAALLRLAREIRRPGGPH